jgi:hypothetical protein
MLVFRRKKVKISGVQQESQCWKTTILRHNIFGGTSIVQWVNKFSTYYRTLKWLRYPQEPPLQIICPGFIVSYKQPLFYAHFVCLCVLRFLVNTHHHWICPPSFSVNVQFLGAFCYTNALFQTGISFFIYSQFFRNTTRTQSKCWLYVYFNESSCSHIGPSSEVFFNGFLQISSILLTFSLLMDK